jgi:hypothetical protein
MGHREGGVRLGLEGLGAVWRGPVRFGVDGLGTVRSGAAGAP